MTKKSFFLPKYLLFSIFISSISSSLLNCFTFKENENNFKYSKKNDILLFYFFALFSQQQNYFKRKYSSFLLSQNFLLPIALFTAGSALCILNSELLHSFSVLLLGLSLSIICPAIWLQLINELNIISPPINYNQLSSFITILLVSYNFGPLIFPFILTKIYLIYGGPELFRLIQLFFIFLMVINFVFILNNQANQQQQQQISGNQFWHWFRGEGGRRTRRSIRLFVNNFRESLRRKQRINSRNRNNCIRGRNTTNDSVLLEDFSFGHLTTTIFSRQTNLFSSKQMFEQQKTNEKNICKTNLLKTQYSLPSIIIQQETPTKESCSKK
ncbi:hypothetical protein Mgra_00000214 [Meloidogyne graminicola]|uniref:Transmembrane protein n=1 Tax=Meloidogyne graminicola TaxID=189291 RepID=A0A8T0A2P3_9BILA|nr:hypothetical protein Mgra_00000214 [Meloidogyne graminicola]